MTGKFVSYAAITMLVLASWAVEAGCMERSKKPEEQIDIIATATSPSNDHVATVYTVSGGGAAGYAYRVVNLRKQSETFNPKKGVIFSATGTREVTCRWEDNEHLMVNHSKAGNIYTQAKEWGSDKIIRISYVGID
jgi:hypothetical protein